MRLLPTAPSPADGGAPDAAGDASAGTPAATSRAGLRRGAGTLGVLALTAAVSSAALTSWSPVRVHSGDTLWGLAATHHTSVAAVQRANHLRGSEIRAGQLLLLPGPGAAAAARPAAARSYRVRPGDTVDAIAARFGTDVATVARRNHLSGSLVVYVGQMLSLPPARAAAPGPAHLTGAAARDRAVLTSRWQPDHATVRAMVRAEALRQGVDPRLAMAIATMESGFDQRAVSGVDAVGVMQLMPQTAVWVSQLVGRHLDRMQAADNIAGGVALLRVLTRSAPLKDAIAGYYQGLGSVQSRGMYADTKNYVKVVLEIRASIR